MALNPLAAEFVPHGLKKQELAYTGWGRDGFSLRNKGIEYHEHECGESSNSLSDIPKEIIATIFAKLQNPADVLAAAMVNRSMLRIASEAALKLRMEPSQMEQTGQSFLSDGQKHFAGTLELDLSGCSMVEDEEVIEVLNNLPSLKFLDLSACRKLTPGFLQRALHANFLTSKCRGNSQGSLQVLGLQRCFQLDSYALTDILKAAASTHSGLSVVALSHLTLDKWPIDWGLRPLKLVRISQGLPKFPAAHGIECSSLKILALHNCKKIAADGLAYLAACCPELEMLLLGGSTLDVPIHLEDEDRSGSEMPAEDPSSLAPSILGAPRNLGPYWKRCAAVILDAVQALTKLRVLELTFYFPELVAIVAEELPTIQVWEFTKPASLVAAQQLKEAHRYRESFSGIALALSAAASCSDSRHTPLHDAVLRGCSYSLKALLKLGVPIEAKDQRGATPLFLACEANRLGCAALLLKAGAEVRSRNSSGEAPLYIAALRGHEGIVSDLLKAFHERGLRWTESSLYGDNFNPLMAATVADRYSIAVMLLRAAGSEAESLVMARNRYGQTAGHIAARRGSHMLLKALIGAAGGLVAIMPDNDGKTPLAVARANKQEQAVEILQKAAEAFQGEWPKSSTKSSKSGRKPQNSRAQRGL